MGKKSHGGKHTPKAQPALSFTALEDIDHIMLNLAHNFKALMSLPPEFATANLDDIDPSQEELLVAAQRPRIRLAQTIVREAKNGHMSLIKTCIRAREGKAIDLTKRPPTFESDVGSYQEDKKRKLEVKKSDVDVNGEWPPKLPVIHDLELKQQVFTHSSSVSIPERLAKAELLTRHNERLEFKGDSVIDFFVCSLLYDRFPEADEGALTFSKAKLVCNTTLWEFAMIYELPKHLRTQIPIRDTPQTPISSR